MNKKLIAAIAATTMAGATGFASVASAAAEFHWYGSVRAGATFKDADKGDSTTDLGTDHSSRFGIKASTDLGNGQTAGLKIERKLADGFAVRDQNVWIGGGWGKLTFGEQSPAYRTAANWDQTYFIGGNIRFKDNNDAQGIRYSSNLGGPFSFDVMIASKAAKGAIVSDKIGSNPKQLAVGTDPSATELVLVPAIAAVEAVGTDTVGQVWASRQLRLWPG